MYLKFYFQYFLIFQIIIFFGTVVYPWTDLIDLNYNISIFFIVHENNYHINNIVQIK